MPTTKSFNDLVKAHLQMSPEFRRSLLRETIASMVEGDVDAGKVLLRNYINGTLGFIPLGEALGRSPKALMQMLGPKGNPGIRNFFEIIAYLQTIEGPILRTAAPRRPRKLAVTRSKRPALARVNSLQRAHTL